MEPAAIAAGVGIRGSIVTGGRVIRILLGGVGRDRRGKLLSVATVGTLVVVWSIYLLKTHDAVNCLLFGLPLIIGQTRTREKQDWTTSNNTHTQQRNR
jgi:hypothetical protein